MKSGKYSYPTPLSKHYLLDNRGIAPSTVFLKITYEEYAKRTSPPSPTEMVNMILDKDPFVEICNCGNRATFKDIVPELNELIQKGGLNKCKKLE